MLKKWTFGLAMGLALAACGGQNTTNTNNNTHSGSTPVANGAQSIELLNVSYDVMRDFYKDYNPLFIKQYKEKNPNVNINVQQSHGGSSKQALSVANGLAADVVTMNQESDITLLKNKQLVDANWEQNFPTHAVPFTSVSVLIVKKGNPKSIQDFADLTKEGVQVVMANPKTSGNGRYAFLSVYGSALKNSNNNHDVAKDLTRKLLANVAVLDAGGRGATTTFAQRGIGDVLITFENEAHTIVQQFGSDKFEIVYPKYTIAAENPVAVVKSVTEKKGTTAAAQNYLAYLWSDEAQNLAASLYLRPSQPEVLAKYTERFPSVHTFRANDVFGAWDDIMKTHFADGGVFDQLNQRR